MIEFILNDQLIRTEAPGNLSLLDFIRKERHLYGTKLGCREGDCGACTVMEGALIKGELTYKSIVSCLTPLVNVHARHIVTIEGLSKNGLFPVQNAIVQEGGTQCGFCTPGFVVSLTSYILSGSKQDPLQFIAGNVCRCTGYKSIERAAHEISGITKELAPGDEVKTLTEKGWLPEYFSSIKQRIKKITPSKASYGPGEQLIGGGTDLMVQSYDEIRHTKLVPTEGWLPDTVEMEDEEIILGGGLAIQSFFDSQIVRSALPRLQEIFPLIASEQIRNMGTLAGNIVNASPIGDLSIMLLALKARLILENKSKESRQLELKDFFFDYKAMDLKEDEIIKYIIFNTLEEGGQFSFEKVSKRRYLDIASVNSAISIVVDNGIIKHLGYAVGGVAPVPRYMSDTVTFLSGKKLDLATLKSALDMMQTELTPISDIRGSREYKRLLASQLFLQHFLSIFSDIFSESDIRILMTNRQIPHEVR